MFENRGEIKIRNKTYPLLFNVVTLLKVNEKYGGIKGLAEALEKSLGEATGDFIWIIALMAEQGIALKNFEEGTDEKALTPEQIKLLMKPKEIWGQRDTIIGAINDGMSNESSPGDEEEEVDEVLEEVLSQKNVTGAGE